MAKYIYFCRCSADKNNILKFQYVSGHQVGHYFFVDILIFRHMVKTTWFKLLLSTPVFNLYGTSCARTKKICIIVNSEK